MSVLARVSFFVKLSIADLFFYTIPRLLSTLFVRWPSAVLRFLRCRGGRRAGELGERDVEVVYHHDNDSTARAFGLVGGGKEEEEEMRSGKHNKKCAAACPRPSLRYDGPLYNAHIHTLFNALRPAWHQFEYARHLVQSGDGQHLHLDVLLPSMLRGSGDQTSDAAEPAVDAVFFVVPGLLNASTTNYVRNFAYQMASQRFGVAVLNYRGMGSTPLEVPRLFSATFTEDIRYVLEHYLSPEQVRALVVDGGCAAPAPGECLPLIGVGFSLGGVTLIKYASEEGLRLENCEAGKNGNIGDGGEQRLVGHGACRLDALVAVTAPYDLIASDEATRRPVYKRLYEKPFGVGLQKFVSHNRDVIAALPNVDSAALFHGEHPLIREIRSIRRFDELINASHNGFASTEDYYRAANSLPWLRHCHTPCLCLASRGDPVTGAATPSALWAAHVTAHNASVVYVCFPVGGHLGFVGRPWAEVAGGANAMERFVRDAARCFVESTRQGVTAPLPAANKQKNE